jgi:hypothetical protein
MPERQTLHNRRFGCGTGNPRQSERRKKLPKKIKNPGEPINLKITQEVSAN